MDAIGPNKRLLVCSWTLPTCLFIGGSLHRPILVVQSRGFTNCDLQASIHVKPCPRTLLPGFGNHRGDEIVFAWFHWCRRFLFNKLRRSIGPLFAPKQEKRILRACKWPRQHRLVWQRGILRRQRQWLGLRRGIFLCGYWLLGHDHRWLIKTVLMCFLILKVTFLYVIFFKLCLL